MNRNTYCNPRLLIDGKEISYISKVNFKDDGNNTLQSLSVTFSEPELENLNLFNEKVEFYLNYGSEDGVPLFRGYIKSFRTSEKTMSISAVDPRTFISGQHSLPIVIDEANNYDGYTVIQFLADVLDNNLNINKTILSSEALKEMDKPVFMNGIRTVQAPYDIIKTLIEPQRDDDDAIEIYEYFLSVIHGGKDTSLTVRKTKTLDGSPDFIYSYYNGINALSYTERAPPSFGLATSEDGSVVRFDYGNAPRGNRGITVAGKFSSREEARKAAMAEVMLKQNDDKDISLTVTKGCYLDLGSIIRIDVPDINVAGQYRITSKSIQWATGKMGCSFNLNKKPLKLSDYI